MPFIDRKLVRVAASPDALKSGGGKVMAATFWAFTTIVTAAPASAATLSRSVDIHAEPSAVWAAIGPFCAIADWHPAIASCAVDGAFPPTRVLATKDAARFVERQTGRSEAQRFYSYTFLESPLPVSHYASTLSVTSKAPGVSTITWSGRYDVTPEQATQAQAALAGIYESGLAAIKAKLDR